VLGFRAAEVAESLETSVAAVNSALQRARATLEARGVDDLDAPAEAPLPLLERYVDAFERYDVDALTRLLHDDACMSMPPYDLWLRGHESIRAWLSGPGAPCRGSRLIPTSACGSRAFGQYRRTGPGRHTPWSLILLELSGERITAMTHFLDTTALFPRFDLPLELLTYSTSGSTTPS
jgi:RNA polymerase sigma-70 factor (ECF subfamily)